VRVGPWQIMRAAVAAEAEQALQNEITWQED